MLERLRALSARKPCDLLRKGDHIGLPDRPDNRSNGVVPGTSTLALGRLIRPHEILGYLVVPKFFCPDIIVADVQGTEQVGL